MRVGSLLLLVCLLLAACGGSESDETAADVTVGDAVVATRSPDAVGVDIEDSTELEGGIVQGEPSIPEGDEPPAVGVGDERARCAGTTLTPTPANLRDVRSATVCLVNAERAARRLPPLRQNRVLARSASVHSADMVAQKYFSHDSRDGSDFAVRIQRAGYMRAGTKWTVGENLAWGTAELATPAGIVDSWMNSPGHRANILNRTYKEIGIAVALGVPVTIDAPGATYATSFGARFG